MRRSCATILLLALASVAGCKKQSALEAASSELPEGEEPLSPSEVRAYVAREEAKRRKQQRKNGGPGANQVNAATSGQQTQVEPQPDPAPTPTPAAEPSPAGNAPWSGALIEFDGSYVLLKGKIEFGNDDKSLKGQSTAVLDEVAKMLQERPAVTKVEVQAHVHGKFKGDAAAATQKRADAARDYLRGQGIDGNRIVAKGYGSEMPIDTNRTEAGRAANTRVEIIVKGINGSPPG